MFIKKNIIFFWSERNIPRFYLSIKCIINLILFYFLKIFIKKNQSYNFNSILFINTEKMGDIILSLDFLLSFQEQVNYSQRYLLVEKNYKDLLKLFPLKYKILTYDKNKYRFNLIYRIKILQMLKKFKFSTVVNITPERGSLNDELSILSSGKTTISIKSTSPFLIKSITKIYNLHYSKFIESDSVSNYKSLNQLAKYFQINFLDQNKRNSNINNYQKSIKKVILIAPSASDKFRNWKKNNFKELVDILSKESKIILMGTSKQKKIIKYISNNNQNIEIKIDLTYEEMYKILNSVNLFIGLDSGVTHFALQLNKPTIAIIGGGKYGKFFPYKESSNVKFLFYSMDCFGCEWHCKYKEPYCINKISVNEVYYLINKIF